MSRRAWDTVDFCLTPLGQEQFNSRKKMLYYYAGKSFRYYRNQGVLLTFDEVLSACSHGLIRAIHEYDQERGTKFSTCAYVWMFKHVQKEAKSWYAYNKYQKSIIDDLLPNVFGGEHKPFDESNAKSDLQTLMAKAELTDKQQNRLRMLFFLDLTLVEIGRNENTSFQAIQLSATRALQKLKECSK